ncbi:hypothetical protein [Streptomyces chartreusis]|uniref:Uncharacterized protein n=1 Tax=Streptomyces chartreusis TaxID=1969 RepID=A0A7H8TJZ7_STRCX|nr:hypothetical protein [Streptomyces chartreusis]QKZ23841.1 hypothetical protein HUT05_44690 [Streptomyces chartreusis]
MPSTGPDPSQITTMQSLLTAHRLTASLPAEGMLTVDLGSGARITVTTADERGPLWVARAGETSVYDSPTAERLAAADLTAADVSADLDTAWAAEAVARYAAEAERGTNLSHLYDGSLGCVLERAFEAHGIPIVAYPGSTVQCSGRLVVLPDGNDIALWDAVHTTASIPAADYERFGAAYRLVDDSPRYSEVPEEEIPLVRTGSLWGDLAILIHTVKAWRDAVS